MAFLTQLSERIGMSTFFLPQQVELKVANFNNWKNSQTFKLGKYTANVATIIETFSTITLSASLNVDDKYLTSSSDELTLAINTLVASFASGIINTLSTFLAS